MIRRGQRFRRIFLWPDLVMPATGSVLGCAASRTGSL